MLFGIGQGNDVETDAQWTALVHSMGTPEWASDPKLSHESGRRAAHDRIDAELAGWLKDQKVEQAVEALAAVGVPVGTLRPSQDLDTHPQLDARGFFSALEHPVAGRLDYPGFPMRFSGRYLPIRRPAPTLGQHNDEVLAGLLGLSHDEIEQLRREKVIGERPVFM